MSRKSDKLWRDALHIAVKRIAVDDKGEERQRLAMIAEKCALMALDGDMAAIREIGDRLDGKAVQAIAGDPDNPLQIEFVTIYEAKPET